MTSLQTFGGQKFPVAALLASSAGRGWSGIQAELRAHPQGEILPVEPRHMEITIALDATPGYVQRRAGALCQRTPVNRGTIWFCPIGFKEDDILLSASLSRILHLFIGAEMFIALDSLRSENGAARDIPYLADIDDELVRQLARRVLQELEQETAAGKLLVEQIAMAMLTHVHCSYAGRPAAALSRTSARGRLDSKRLARVIDFMESHLEQALSLTDLAEVACLSPFHFARAFKETMGVPPHRYLSERRLAHARNLLDDTSHSIADVALACCFSSQASFTRSFQRSTGMTPGAYRAATASARPQARPRLNGNSNIR